MNTIEFNDTSFSVDTYNKNTYLLEGRVVQEGSCIIGNSNLEALYELMSETITTIRIYHNDNLIYNDEDLNVTISGINEYLADDRVVMSLNLKFDNQ